MLFGDTREGAVGERLLERKAANYSPELPGEYQVAEDGYARNSRKALSSARIE